MNNRNNSKGKSVALFATCLVDLIRPEVGYAAVDLIEQSGFEVDVPHSQTCCGQPLYNSGDLAGTRKIAQKFIDTFSGYDYVVAPSGSCAAMVRIHFPELFDEVSGQTRENARELASRTYELTEFLVKVAGIRLSSEFHQTCTYHDSCSGFRELGIKSSPRTLLSEVRGLQLIESRESAACCGFGGTFCVKYPEISAHIAAEKVNNICASGAHVLLGGDLGCLMNIAGTLSRQGTTIRVLHVAEVLAGRGNNPAIGEASS